MRTCPIVHAVVSFLPPDRLLSMCTVLSLLAPLFSLYSLWITSVKSKRNLMCENKIYAWSIFFLFFVNFAHNLTRFYRALGLFTPRVSGSVSVNVRKHFIDLYVYNSHRASVVISALMLQMGLRPIPKRQR